MQTSRLWQKVGASAVNCSLVLLLSLGLYPFVSVEFWKINTVAIFFIYNVLFRSRCLGMRLVGTFSERPASILYVALYSLGYSTFFYSVWIPGDLLAANAAIQIGSVTMTGNTAHANLAGQGTINREQYVERAQLRALALVNQGHLGQAVGSMACDLNRYPELRALPEMTIAALHSAKINDVEAVREWIMGFK